MSQWFSISSLLSDHDTQPIAATNSELDAEDDVQVTSPILQETVFAALCQKLTDQSFSDSHREPKHSV